MQEQIFELVYAEIEPKFTQLSYADSQSFVEKIIDVAETIAENNSDYLEFGKSKASYLKYKSNETNIAPMLEGHYMSKYEQKQRNLYRNIIKKL